MSTTTVDDLFGPPRPPVELRAFASRSGMTHLSPRPLIGRRNRARCGRMVYAAGIFGAAAVAPLLADHKRLSATHDTDTCRRCFDDYTIPTTTTPARETRETMTTTAPATIAAPTLTARERRTLAALRGSQVPLTPAQVDAALHGKDAKRSRYTRRELGALVAAGRAVRVGNTYAPAAS